MQEISWTLHREVVLPKPTRISVVSHTFAVVNVWNPTVEHYQQMALLGWYARCTSASSKVTVIMYDQL
jgi:hypothetical protein